jgi:hypothetical protein
MLLAPFSEFYGRKPVVRPPHPPLVRPYLTRILGVVLDLLGHLHDFSNPSRRGSQHWCVRLLPFLELLLKPLQAPYLFAALFRALLAQLHLQIVSLISTF